MPYRKARATDFSALDKAGTALARLGPVERQRIGF
jgi:hypothetical protein